MACRGLLLMLLWLAPTIVGSADLMVTSRPEGTGEVVSTAAVIAGNVLFVASYEPLARLGHLRAMNLTGDEPLHLWDAAERIPVPGATLPPAVAPDLTALAPRFGDQPGRRVLFTNLGAAQGYRQLSLEAAAAHELRPLLGVATLAEATALINAVRGRMATSAANPAGQADRAHRLGAISRSSPALVGGSPVAAGGARRDQVLYVGGEDGLLHAILAGRGGRDRTDYDHTADGCGWELWGYLPGSLLSYLQEQPFEVPGELPAIHVDGAPAVGDLFIDSDGDGRREWRTILIGTASAQRHNRGVVFALDVTDPRAPRLLWETALPELGPGRSRGAALGWVGEWSHPAPRVFLTFGTSRQIDAAGNVDALNGRHGLLACALDLEDGRLLWRFAAQYPEPAADFAEPPSIPSLLTAADGAVEGVVFGDLAGRLWVLDAANGYPRGGGPLWQTPGGVNEPIGAGLAVRDRQVVFGTGGVERADANGSYAVYAVEIAGVEARLLWRQPLAPGEKLWGAPVVDRFGQVCVAVGSGREGEAGRLLMLSAEGRLLASVSLAETPFGRLAVVQGTVVAVSRTGRVEQFGPLRAGSPGEESGGPGRVRVLSWRVR